MPGISKTLRCPIIASPPFVIFALPRSRTAWLARFLTYGDWSCGHEELRHCRTLRDVRAWLSQPCIGTAETAGAPFWRLLRQYRPDARVVTIRRPVGQVMDSLMRRGSLDGIMRRLDRKLDQIEARIPGVLRVEFSDLATEAGCARVFEHCTGYAHEPVWWAAMARQNVQISMPALMKYYAAHKGQLDTLRQMAKQQIISAMGRNADEIEGVTIQQEPFETFLRDGERLTRRPAPTCTRTLAFCVRSTQTGRCRSRRRGAMAGCSAT